MAVKWFGTRRRRRGRGRFVPIAAIRATEIDRLLVTRYGAILPDDDAGRADALLFAHHAVRASKDPQARLCTWLATRAPWLTADEAAELLADAIAKPLRYKADTLGARLGLTAAERDKLAIRTIGAIDLPKAERATRRRDKDRQRKHQARRKAGAKPRPVMEAGSINRAKPWLIEGVSRATWYRRRDPNPSGHRGGHTCVTAGRL